MFLSSIEYLKLLVVTTSAVSNGVHGFPGKAGKKTPVAKSVEKKGNKTPQPAPATPAKVFI